MGWCMSKNIGSWSQVSHEITLPEVALSMKQTKEYSLTLPLLCSVPKEK
jgi:hypothetical protein